MDIKNINIKELIERITEDGVVTKHEHQMLLDAVSADGVLTEEEAKAVAGLMQRINDGELKVFSDY